MRHASIACDMLQPVYKTRGQHPFEQRFLSFTYEVIDDGRAIADNTIQSTQVHGDQLAIGWLYTKSIDGRTFETLGMIC